MKNLLLLLTSNPPEGRGTNWPKAASPQPEKAGVQLGHTAPGRRRKNAQERGGREGRSTDPEPPREYTTAYSSEGCRPVRPGRKRAGGEGVSRTCSHASS